MYQLSDYEGALVLEQEDFNIGLLSKKIFVHPDKLINREKFLVFQRIGILTNETFARILKGVCTHLTCEKNSGK